MEGGAAARRAEQGGAKREKKVKEAYVFVTGAFKLEFDDPERMEAFWQEYRALDHTIGKGAADARIGEIAARYGGRLVEHKHGVNPKENRAG